MTKEELDAFDVGDISLAPSLCRSSLVAKKRWGDRLGRPPRHILAEGTGSTMAAPPAEAPPKADEST